jgi:hypothetical protein
LELEKKIKIMRKFENQIEGKITMKKYCKVYKNNGWPPLQKLLGNLRWNELKSIAFNENYSKRIKWNIEKAKATYTKACKYFDKNEIITKEYQKYRKKFGGICLSSIIDRYRWVNFKRLVEGKNPLSFEEERRMKEFCSICADKENCSIELKNCKYWEEWNNV